jgi:WD40 repeat protein
VVKKKGRRKLFIILPLLIIIGVLAYYQLLYKSERVDNGIAKLEMIFDKHRDHDGKLLASTSDDKTIKIWNVAEQELIRTMKVPEPVQAVAFSPDDKRLMTGGRDKPMIGEFLQEIFGDSKFNPGVSARLWDVGTGKLLQTFTKHANDVMDVAYSYDGKWIATASADKTVDIWELKK